MHTSCYPAAVAGYQTASTSNNNNNMNIKARCLLAAARIVFAGKKAINNAVEARTTQKSP
jgi:hypothetical protein